MADKNEKQVETTGHSWDGIEELNSPLPRWWLWTFYATILWGLVYSIAYPAWPLINGATAGFLGYSTRAEVAKAIADHEEKNAALTTALASADLTTLATTDDIYKYALSRGKSVFQTNCSQCHGAGAGGSVGYPNLLDNDWLWGGDIQSIAYTISHGIRNNTDPDARFSQMPAFGEFLSEEEIAAVVAHVQALSGPAPEGADLALGTQVFADNCAACHGDAGTGDREQGAPNLADRIWLFGNSPEALLTSVSKARFGVMPAWGARLSPADVNAVAAYVHARGGGE